MNFEAELKKTPVALRVYADRINLKKVAGEWTGLCPLHSETTPSFKLFEQDGVLLFRCFGCSVSGNVFQFIQKLDACGFSEAVEKVKSISEWKDGKNKVEQTFKEIGTGEKKYITFPIEKLGPAEAALSNSEIGRNWLASRSIVFDTAQSFHLGYVQSAKAVTPVHPWLDAGWILFPTIENGIVTCLKYRSVRGKKTETGEPGFLRKSGMRTGLFNSDAIEPFDDVFVTEGEIDTLTLAQAGYIAVSLPSAGFSPTPEMRDRLVQANTIYLAGDMDAPGRAAMTKLWSELRDRTYLIEWPEGCKDANDALQKACGGRTEDFRVLVEDLKQKARSRPMPHFYDLKESLKNADDTNPMDDPKRLHFPWRPVDEMAVCRPGSVVSSYATYTGSGKALKHGTPILTPDGWVPIELVKTGSFVIGCDGNPTEVLGVYPQGVRPAYRVSFSCGTEIICDADHLWEVERSAANYPKKSFIRTTKQLSERKLTKSAPYKVPEISPVRFADKELPIHPYLLGVLIGDGGFTNCSLHLTSADKSILEKVGSLLPTGMYLQHITKYDYRIVGGCRPRKRHANGVFRNEDDLPHPLRRELKKLHLLGERSEHKFVPQIYMRGSVEQRLELLRGLLDTDGTVNKSVGAVSFCSSSHILAEQVKHLVFSLGGFASVRPKKTKRLMAYNVSINLPTKYRLFWLERKHKLASQRKGWRRVRAFRKIEPCGQAEMTCIKVAAQDGIFLTTDYIPTHNTTWWLSVQLNEALKYNSVVINYSAELSPAEIASLVTAIITKKDRLTLSRKDFDESAEILKDARFYVGYNPDASSIKQVIGDGTDKNPGLLEWAIRRLGANIVVLDHLHFFTSGDKDATTAEAAAMTRIKNLAVKYNLIFIVIGQSRKAQPSQKYKVSEGSDAKGSEAFVSTANTTYHIHRDIRRDINFDDPASWPSDILDQKTDIRLYKCRTKGPGKAVARLWFEGANGRFREMVSEPCQ